jgi:hypothetical protein
MIAPADLPLVHGKRRISAEISSEVDSINDSHHSSHVEHTTKEGVLKMLLGRDVGWPSIELPASTMDIAQAIKDFRREKVLLNGVRFTPELNSVDNNDTFAASVRNLCSILCRMFPDNEMDALQISDSILRKSCRTGCGADSFFAVHKMFAVEHSILMQNTRPDDPPIEIDVFFSQGCLYAHTECFNSFILVDSSEIEKIGDSEPVPWLYIDTFVTDETNFTTGESRRKLDIIAPARRPTVLEEKRHRYRRRASNSSTTHSASSADSGPVSIARICGVSDAARP